MAEAALQVAAVPVVDVDPFSHAVLDDPYPFYSEMREAGPVVFLPAYRCYAVGRHDEVQSILTNWEGFTSAAGVGLANFNREPPWRPPSLILEADPPQHTRMRQVLARVLSPGAIRALTERFAREADVLIDRIVEMRRFDGVADLAEYYPVKVFPDAVGLPPEGREHLLPYGSMVFNAVGPRNAITAAAFAKADVVVPWITAACARDALTKDGLGADIYRSVDTGELTAEEAPMLVRSFLSAGVDTTVNALGNLLWCLASFPDQWDKLRAQPTLARGAFEESLRYEGTLQIFFRTTTRDVEIGGCPVSGNEKVAVFFGSANRDPRRWNTPEQFDITRRATGHMAFGTGIHGCVGQQVARLEAEAVLGALLRKVRTLRLTGAPKRQYANVLRAYASLPMEVVPV